MDLCQEAIDSAVRWKRKKRKRIKRKKIAPSGEIADETARATFRKIWKSSSTKTRDSAKDIDRGRHQLERKRRCCELFFLFLIIIYGTFCRESRPFLPYRTKTIGGVEKFRLLRLWNFNFASLRAANTMKPSSSFEKKEDIYIYILIRYFS